MGSQQLCHKISSLKKFRQNLHTTPKKKPTENPLPKKPQK